MSYILFSTTLNRPLARIDADYETATSGEGELLIPCTPDANPDDIDYWRAEATKPPVEPTEAERLAKAKELTLQTINLAADTALATLTQTYPNRELSTFDKQESEARAYLADATSSTPFLSALAAAREIELSDLVGRVIAKADAFASVSGCIIGQRQALEDRLDAADTVEEVVSIVIKITMPGVA